MANVQARLVAHYASGTVRYRRWDCDDDVRSYRPPKGWQATADLIEIHPITVDILPRLKTGDSYRVQRSVAA